MRAKFKVLLGERLCKKAFGADLGEFSQKGALMSAFKTHLSELKRAFASHKGIFLGKCQKGEFESKRVKKNFGVGISLSLSLSLVSASTLCAECA